MSKLSQERIRVLNQFESKAANWTYGSFESALSKEMGRRYGNYQTAKATIMMAAEDGRWPKTVKRYVLTNYVANGNSPAGLVDICRQLLMSMSSQEKESWNLPKSPPGI